MGLGNPTIEYIDPKLYLEDFLHPTFKDLATDLEFSILRLRYSSEMLLSRYGNLCTQRSQAEIQDLGEAVMWIYAMFASIGRSSRSYCIGLRYSAYETVAAASLMDAEPQILKMALDIKRNQSGYYGYKKTVAENALKQFRNPTSGVISKKCE